MCSYTYVTHMGIRNGDGLERRIHLTLTVAQDEFLDAKVREGKYLSKQGAIRDILDHEMESASA